MARIVVSIVEGEKQMVKSTKPQRFVKALVGRVFSGLVFARILIVSYKYLQWARGWPSVRIGRVRGYDDVYEVRVGGRDVVYIYNPERVGRYVHSAGLGYVVSDLEKKYFDGECEVRAGDVVVDVGANIGEFSLAAKRNEAKHIYSIEPDVMARKCLQLNDSAWAMGVEILPYLVSDIEGDVVFYYAKDADSSIYRPDVYEDAVTMHATTIDNLAMEKNIDKVDFMKVESEGWEPEVLAGAEETLKKTRKISVDAGPERGGQDTIKPVRGLLERAGFLVWVKGNVVYGVRETLI